MIGFINVNKPLGLTSAQVVARVKRILHLDKTTKVGHTGTLDPQACGVLPVAIGKATRLFDFMLSKTKEYEAEFTFGYETDTLDSAGKVINSSEKIPTLDDVNCMLSSFIGKIDQLPPMYSAKSVNGKRAYDMARSGKQVNLTPCKVEINEFHVLSHKGSSVLFKIVCGSGTYIRALCRDLAHSLGAFATMTKLTRTRAGVFCIDSAVSLDSLTPASILPCEIVLGKLDSLNVDKTIVSKLKCGQMVDFSTQKQSPFKVYCNDELIGLGESVNNNLKIKIWLS